MDRKATTAQLELLDRPGQLDQLEDKDRLDLQVLPGRLALLALLALLEILVRLDLLARLVLMADLEALAPLVHLALRVRLEPPDHLDHRVVVQVCDWATTAHILAKHLTD